MCAVAHRTEAYITLVINKLMCLTSNIAESCAEVHVDYRCLYIPLTRIRITSGLFGSCFVRDSFPVESCAIAQLLMYFICILILYVACFMSVKEVSRTHDVPKPMFITVYRFHCRSFHLSYALVRAYITFCECHGFDGFCSNAYFRGPLKKNTFNTFLTRHLGWATSKHF
jgi:hypothetical protein